MSRFGRFGKQTLGPFFPLWLFLTLCGAFICLHLLHLSATFHLRRFENHVHNFWAFFTDHDNIKSQSANFSSFQSRELLKIVVLKIFPYYAEKRNSKMLWHFDCLFKSDADLNNWGFAIIIRSNFFCICDANKHCNLSQTKVKLWVHLQ